MVSLRFSVVLIAVAVVLCAQLMAASAKPTKHRQSQGSGRSRSSSSARSNTRQTTHSGGGRSSLSTDSRGGHSSSNTHLGGSHSSSSTHSGGSHSSTNTHPSNQHRSSGDFGRSHSSGLGSAFSHYDTSPRTPGGRRGGSNGHHGGSGKSYLGSSSSSGPDKRRGRGRGGQKNHGSHGVGSQGHGQGWRRNQRIRINKEKKIEEYSKKGLFHLLSKQISTRRGMNIDLGSILAKVKNSTSECAQKSQGAILDFATNTVSKSLFGTCQESQKFAKLQEDLENAEKAFRKIENNQNKQLKSCKTEEGAKSIMAGTINPSWMTVPEALGLTVTQEEKEGDSFDGEDQNMEEWEEECRKRVEDNTVFMEEDLEQYVTRLRKEMDNTDKRELDSCWSQDFGKNLADAGISSLMETISCATVEKFIG